MSGAVKSADLLHDASRACEARARGIGELDEATRALTAVLYRRLRRRFGDRLKGLILFGSRARGDHAEDSDADVAVVLAGPIGKPFAMKSAVIDDTYDLFLDSGILIQPWPIEEAWLDDPMLAPYPHVVTSMLREGIRL